MEAQAGLMATGMSAAAIEISVDIAFITNWVTDWAWLWATSALAGISPRRGRLAIAAAFGAAAAVWAWFPSGDWLATGPGAVLGTVLLLTIAFWPLRLVEGLRLVAYFILIGAAMAGVTLLMGARSHGLGLVGGVNDISPAMVSAGLLLTLVGARYLWDSARDRARLKRGLFGLRIRLGERSIELPALLDTGNGLKDPLSGTPVAVVEAAALGDLLPPLLQAAVEAGWDTLERLPGSWAQRCRLVPYRAVGQTAGLMLALAPDGVAVREPDQRNWREVRILLGLAGQSLHAEGTYQALLPPHLPAAGRADGRDSA